MNLFIFIGANCFIAPEDERTNLLNETINTENAIAIRRSPFKPLTISNCQTVSGFSNRFRFRNNIWSNEQSTRIEVGVVYIYVLHKTLLYEIQVIVNHVSGK